MKKTIKYQVVEFSIELKGINSISNIRNITAFDGSDYDVVAEFETPGEAVTYLEEHNPKMHWNYNASFKGYLVEGASVIEVATIINTEGEEVEFEVNGITTSKVEYEVIKEDGKDVVATFDDYFEAEKKAEELEEETGDTYLVDDRA